MTVIELKNALNNYPDNAAIDGISVDENGKIIITIDESESAKGKDGKDYF